MAIIKGPNLVFQRMQKSQKFLDVERKGPNIRIEFNSHVNCRCEPRPFLRPAMELATKEMRKKMRKGKL